MRDPDRPHRLLHGPYVAPACQVGDVLTCAIRGKVRVVGFSDVPTPWPTTRMLDGVGKPFLIVCGGLLEALGKEGQAAIAVAWGVSIATVARWRLALRDHAYRAKLRRVYRDTDRVATSREQQTGQRRGPLAPETRAKMSSVHQARWEQRHASGIGWQIAWDKLLGTMPDRQLAKQVGMSGQTVYQRRKALGIATHSPRPNRNARTWTAEEDALLGTMSDSALAARLGCHYHAVSNRRAKLGVPAFSRGRPARQASYSGSGVRGGTEP